MNAVRNFLHGFIILNFPIPDVEIFAVKAQIPQQIERADLL